MSSWDSITCYPRLTYYKDVYSLRFVVSQDDLTKLNYKKLITYHDLQIQVRTNLVINIQSFVRRRKGIKVLARNSGLRPSLCRFFGPRRESVRTWSKVLPQSSARYFIKEILLKIKQNEKYENLKFWLQNTN